MQVSNFPFLTDAEFTEACRLIEAQCEQARESRDEKVSWALRCRDKVGVESPFVGFIGR